MSILTIRFLPSKLLSVFARSRSGTNILQRNWRGLQLLRQEHERLHSIDLWPLNAYRESRVPTIINAALNANLGFILVGNFPASIQLYRQRRHGRLYPALGVL